MSSELRKYNFYLEKQNKLKQNMWFQELQK